jgi:hypothetical protein
MRHTHRILPGHRGGEYKKNNTIEVSVTQHAMWHFANFQLWGLEEDRIAWRGLAGIITKEEIVFQALSLGGKKGGSKGGKNCHKKNPSLAAQNGRKARDSGQLLEASKLGGKVSGPVRGALARDSGQLAKAGELAHKKLSKPVLCIETNEMFSSARQAERETGVNCSNITNCCRGGRKTAGGYKWRFT